MPFPMYSAIFPQTIACLVISCMKRNACCSLVDGNCTCNNGAVNIIQFSGPLFPILQTLTATLTVVNPKHSCPTLQCYLPSHTYRCRWRQRLDHGSNSSHCWCCGGRGWGYVHCPGTRHHPGRWVDQWLLGLGSPAPGLNVHQRTL